MARFTDPSYFAKRPWLEYLFIISACLAQMALQGGSMYTFSIVNVLSDYFHTGPAENSWYMSSFALTVGTLILISGRLGDVYGTRLVMLCGYAFTIIFSILGGASYYVPSSPEFFIICRAFQGIGMAFVFPNIIGAVGRVYTPETLRKHIVLSLVGWSAPVGGVFAPFWAGLIAVKTPLWNWIVWQYLIVCTIAMILSWISTPYLPPNRDQSVDWIGCGLAVSGLVLINFVFNQAPLAGWDNAYIITLLVVGFVFMGVFVWYELHIAENPLLPRAVLGNLKIGLILLALFFSWGSFGVMSMRLFAFNLNIRHYTALAAGAAVMPATVAGGIAAMSTVPVMRIVGISNLMILSMVAFLGGNLLMITLPVHQVYWRNTFAIFFVAAEGMDWSFTAGTILLSDVLPHHLQGLSGSLIMTALNYGIAFFVGLDSTVEQQATIRHPGNQLRIHRESEALGVGLAGGATVIAIIVSLIDLWNSIKKKRLAKEHPPEPEGVVVGSAEMATISPVTTKRSTIETA